ncbi:hypothetical protein ALC53_09027, partial [Atta colombica]
RRKCQKIRAQALQQCARVYDYRYVVVGYVLQHPLYDTNVIRMLPMYLKCSRESNKKREKGVGISLSRAFSKKFNTFSECFAGVTRKILKSIDFTVTIGYVSTHADLKSLFKVRKVDLIMQTIVIQFIEDSTPYLIRFKSNPIKCRKLVLCLDLRECNLIINEIPDEPFVNVPVRVSSSIILFSRTLCLRAESCLCLFKAASSSSTDLRVSKASA